jgi:EmrB/QacA subfamily drug resistance transporter
MTVSSMTEVVNGHKRSVSASRDHLETGDPHRWRVLAVLSAVAFMAQLDVFIVNVALAGIRDDFPGASLSAVSWVLSAYAIVLAAVLVPAGRIADRVGRKRVLLLGVAIFTFASAVCAAAPVLPVLVGGRVVQAIGAAMIVPTSLGLLYPAFPKRQHMTVVGIWAGVAAVAASAGPPVGGLLVSASWRWIFVINIPIGVGTILYGTKLISESRESADARRFDVASAASLLIAVVTLVLATVQGPRWGWGDARTVALFVIALIGAAACLQRTLHAAHPIIEKQLFHSRVFTASAIALVLYFCGFVIFLLGSALFMQDVWRFSSIKAGVAIAPAPVMAIGFAVAAGPIQKRFGRTFPALVGAIAMAIAGGFWLVRIGRHPDYWSEMFPGLILMGISGGLFQAPMFAAAGTLPADRATTGSAVLNMSRQVGSAIGVAVLVALTATASPVRGYDHAWAVQIGVALVAASVLVLFGRAVRTRRQNGNNGAIRQ